jgi:ABC-type phosphate transport system substrate-binding protein
MLKKHIKSAILGAALLAIGSTANAGLYSVNLYGASAQYTFWTTSAPEILKSGVASYFGPCATANIYNGRTSDNKHGITVCIGDTAFGGYAARPTGGMSIQNVSGSNHTVVIRYSSKASYDGINAVQGINPEASPECTNRGERLMADLGSQEQSLTAYGSTPGTIAGTVCNDVMIGASDVNAKTFSQKSNGALLGTRGGAATSRNISGYTISSANYNDSKPLIVPFAFYANNNVPFNNMSRLMATQIFSGQVYDWNQFNPALPSLPMAVCMRHAGSGTLATLDAAVMRGDYGLVENEVNASSIDYVGNGGIQPLTWFNDGSGDMKNCLADHGTTVAADRANTGAVGYLDADNTATDSKQLTYEGESPAKVRDGSGNIIDSPIADGRYSFWSAQNLYWYKNEPTATKNLITGLYNYARNPANLTVAKLGAVANFWCTESELLVGKDADKQWPYRQ